MTLVTNVHRVLAVAMTMSAALYGTLTAQADEPSAPASVIVMPTRFASWQDDAHLAGPGISATMPRDTSSIWWGLGTGATIGATAALGVTQAFCVDDNGCVGKSIGAILMGTLVGGALESGMDY